jgi:cytoskeletal protein RodZ
MWRRGVSIGGTLAEARRQSGLTTTQVSQQTCIRETIIRGIEQEDYSACGGDFYTRGHIRSIARAVGTDPDPLIREYDATQGAPQAITAADVFEPASPIKLKERRRPNWSLAMGLAIAAMVGFAIYHIVSAPSHPAAAAHKTTTTSHNKSAHHGLAGHARPKPTVPPPSHPHRVVIDLTAVQSCWVSLTTTAGKTIYSGIIAAGTTQHWTEHQTVSMVIGNPSGITLSVNGKNPVPPGTGSQVVTLSLGPGKKAAAR